MGPLSGVRVLDLTRFPPGGYCTMLLADLGAEVCRVDVPGADLRLNGVGVGLSRAKRSLALNYRHERAMEVLRKVTGWADVLVENNRPGDLENRGFGYRQASEEYPRLVWCAITGFGQDGPYAAWPGHDLTYTAQAGLLTEIIAELPWQPENTLSLPIGGLFAATGIMSALFDRQRNGRGCFIDISLAEATTWFLSGNDASLTADASGLPATPDRRLYECEDGRFVSVAAPDPRAWAALCKGVGLEDLAAAPPAQREPADAADVEARLSAAFASRPASEWVETLGPRGAAIGPVNRGADVVHDAHVKARSGVVEVEGVPLPANPIRLRDASGTPATSTNTTPPSAVGADTESMLAAVGYSPDEIDQLRAEGVVG